MPIQLQTDSVLLYPSLPGTGLMAALMQLEQRVLPGLLRALRQRRLSMLRLVAGTRVYSLSRWGLARFWRSPVAWWEALV
jgi:hypothetical protein